MLFERQCTQFVVLQKIETKFGKIKLFKISKSKTGQLLGCPVVLGR